MDEIAKHILFILISNKDTEAEIYQICKDKLKNKNLNRDGTADKIVNNLKKLRLTVNDSDNSIEEEELEKLPNLFSDNSQRKKVIVSNIENPESYYYNTYDYEQILEIIFNSIELVQQNQQFFDEVHERLLKNIEQYFDSNKYLLVAITCLYALLFYYLKIKYKDVKYFEKNKTLKDYFDSYININIQINSNEMKLFEYLKKFLNHEHMFYKIKAFQICQNLEIPLNLVKMLEFSLEYIGLRKILNLVVFIGRSGVGKTTLINYLTGTEYEILDDPIYENFLIPKKEHFNKLRTTEPQSSFQSQTMYCEVVPLDHEIYLADIPGFFDKRNNNDKSTVAELGLPFLINKTEKLKAIVIVLDFGMFRLDSTDKLEKIRSIGKFLPQIFKNFANISENFNILFAITVAEPNDRIKNEDTLMRIIKNQLVNFKKIVKDNEPEISKNEIIKEICEKEIEIYNKFIDLLDEKHDTVEIIKNVEKMKQNLIEFFAKNPLFKNRFEKLVEDLKKANENKDKALAEKTQEVWSNEKNKVEGDKTESEKIVKEKKAENSMINALEKALASNTLFIFKLVGNHDVKNKFIDKIKSFISITTGIESYFNFDLEHPFFKNANILCTDILEKASNSFDSAKSIAKIFDKKNEEFGNKQFEILQNEKELDFYLSAKPNGIPLGSNNLLRIYEKQRTFYFNSIAIISEQIKKKKLEISRIEEKKFITIYVEQKKFIRKCSSWTVKYRYSEAKSKKKDLFEYNNADVKNCIHRVTLTLDHHYDGSPPRKVHFNSGDENKEGVLEGFGNYKISNSNFKKGIFKLNFSSNDNFYGTVTCFILAEIKNHDQYDKEIEKLEKVIEDYESSTKHEIEIIDKLNESIKDEEMLINATNKTRLSKIQSRLKNLNYQTNTFIEYLLKRDSIRNQSNFKEIKAIFSNINNKEFKNSSVLKTISDEVGLPLESIISIIQFLNEMSKSEEGLIYKQRDFLKKESEEYIKNFEETKMAIKKLEETELNIVLKLVKNIHSFKITESENFVKYLELRNFVTRERILERQLILKRIDETSLNNDYQEDIEDDFLSFYTLNINRNSLPELNFIHDFKLELLNQVDNIKLKSTTINDLIAANDDVNNIINY